MGDLLGALVQQLLLKEPEEPEKKTKRPVSEPRYKWLPDALDFVRRHNGREVLTCEIHSYIRSIGKPLKSDSIVRGLTRAMKDGRAKGLTVRLELRGLHHYKLLYWKWEKENVS